VETSVKVSGTMKSNSVLTLRGAALGGLGVALLPAYCIMDDIANGSLRRLLTDYLGPTEDLCVLYPYSAHVPKKVRVFVDYLIDELRQPPWNA
jgi:DNA-binding transcriptional LysR family regulator